MEADAYFSEDRQFRYWLLRRWDPALPLLAVIGCNPSIASETEDDPTIRKTIGFGERLGHGGVLMLNVGAFCATDPKVWKVVADPFGPENTINHLQGYISKFAPSRVVAAWGKPCVTSIRGTHRAHEIARRIDGMECWGKNSDGSPRHPLMLPYNVKLQLFSKQRLLSLTNEF